MVSDVVSGGSANPRFQLSGHSIAIDPRSRLYDPTDPDRPPMPPDDPDSHRLMQCVDGHRGWPHWYKDGQLDDFEFASFRETLPYDSDGVVRVDLKGAVELARLHSRDYQLQLESLYLSALDVTAGRFAFNAQFYGGNSTQFVTVPPILNGGTRSSSLTNTTNPFMTKLFTTGGTLIVNAANTIVWQFSGNRSTVNTSLLSFALSQPLLQFAGRPRNLEVLTRLERDLLVNLRQYERYRQGFYLSVATGVPNASSVQRSGGVFGGSGLTGFTGVGVGGLGQIGAITGISAPVPTGGVSVAPGGAGGYLGLLQQKQLLRNYRARLSRLRDTWLQLSATFDAGRLENRFQVDFARQAYYEGQSQLLNAKVDFDSLVDSFKTQQLSLPPDVPLDVADETFDRFNFVDPSLTELQDEIGDRLEQLSTANVEGTAVAEGAVTDLANRVRRFISDVTSDLKSMEREVPNRNKALIELAEFPELKESHFDLRAISIESMTDRASILKTEHRRLTGELTELANTVDRLTLDTELTPEEMQRAEKELLTRLTASLLELSLLQARARLNGVAIPPISVTAENAFQVAMTQRPDWMSAKSALVDSWRLIRYNANALRSNLTVNVSGGLTARGTSGINPLGASGTDTQMQAGITIDPPLTRVIERNLFRESLIEYQQSRRGLMSFRDEIHRGIRVRLRQIRRDQLNVELRRLAVDVAITQTDVARLKLVEPEKPVADGKTQTLSPTIARDLVDALTRLQDTQTQFIFTWGSYENQRRQLDFELGTMRLDENGMWIDPGPMTNETLLERYYENCPNPVNGMELNDRTGVVELLPGELPPEPSTLDLPAPADL